ncbi:ATP-binding response regulator [Fluviispira multicolorata]|uniref:histidine kinase n=1 Tax=Fluviispira multicolorata TaxID=2654512 RepID=A0A833JDP1_9BACT|nr:hybrid sensor histidine kinase/response regulator [Fluviispira multicolorata]KAB8029096.1 response regulator [Fluviispira multicolorata]
MPSILIVDDEEMICTYLEMHFRSEGYETFTAKNGIEGIQMCKDHQPNIIISDIKMPQCDGVKFIQVIKENSEYNPVIFYITAYSDVTIDNAYELGVDALFKKPFQIKDIVSGIKKFSKIKQEHSQIEIQKKLNEHQLSENAQLKLIAELSTGISHNINNHISYITTSSYVLRKYLEKIINKENNEDTEKNDLLKMIKISEKIHAHALMTYRIVKSMKMLARKNASDDEKENISLISIIQSAIDLLEEEFKINLIKCTLTYPVDIQIKCYPEQVLQVFLNLLQNACDALSELKDDEKWIQIDVSLNNEKTEVAFTDCGLGIPENVRSHIMEAFFTTKNRGKGTGVGLSLSKRIMEAHDGTLSLDESSKNTRFVASFKST